VFPEISLMRMTTENRGALQACATPDTVIAWKTEFEGCAVSQTASRERVVCGACVRDAKFQGRHFELGRALGVRRRIVAPSDEKPG